MQTPAPWLRFYGPTPATLEYPDGCMADLVAQAAARTPDNVAYDYFGATRTFAQLMEDVALCTRALRAAGVKRGEVVTLCMPNMPQAVVMLYALNRMGAVASLVHPLSSEGELAFALQLTGSRVVLTLDQFYEKFEAVRRQTPVDTLLLTGAGDALPPVKRMGYFLTQGRNVPRVPEDAPVLRWSDFLAAGRAAADAPYQPGGAEDVAAILFSGGTTGTPKGILLTNRNFNAAALQTAAAGDIVEPGASMLAILPIFHGFGLGVCIHTVLTHGCKCILVPQFHMKSFAAMLRKHRPNYIAGVPTLFEAMLRNEQMDRVDLSQLRGVFSGGDTLPVQLKRRVDAFLREHGATVQVREGYGMTECVTASCLTPRDFYREGSIGVPFPDTFYKIVTPATHDALAPGEIGEICISGPSVMRGYLHNERETADTLQLHEDGRVWLHTGDLGSMDADGFVYFRQRLKRVILSSGYNVYPSQIEAVLDAHEAVQTSTVIGMRDDYKMQRVKAFVVLRPGVPKTAETEASIRRWCEKRIAKYALPKEYEFRDSLPQTLVGKVAVRELEAEEESKRMDR